jgi:hypothetical protein
MRTITLTSRPKRQERILEQAIAGTAVVLDLEAGNYYALDGTGARAWELCDGRRDVSEIAAILGNEFDAPGEAIEHDLIELFTELLNEKLVEASV